MNEPKRYKLFEYSGGAEMLDDDGGDYVTLADYARLRSAFDELLTQMHGLRNIAAQEVSLAAILSWCDAAIENAEKERT